jgi:hypothetical protein
MQTQPAADAVARIQGVVAMAATPAATAAASLLLLPLLLGLLSMCLD